MAFIPITERSEKEQRIHKLAYDDGKNNIVNFRWLVSWLIGGELLADKFQAKIDKSLRDRKVEK